jgi:hypothetical protein
MAPENTSPPANVTHSSGRPNVPIVWRALCMTLAYAGSRLSEA